MSTTAPVSLSDGLSALLALALLAALSGCGPAVSDEASSVGAPASVVPDNGTGTAWGLSPPGAVPLPDAEPVPLSAAAQRFVVLAAFANAAVLDKETGLVWEQSPLTTIHPWSDARTQCTSRTTGGRKGWRLPSVHEPASLVDPSVAPPSPTLPPGHPFTINVQSADYWSAPSLAELPSSAWGLSFVFGNVVNIVKPVSLLAWCVRGGMNAEAY